MANLSSLNPQQRLAVEAVQGPILILAGAGTGKTRVITFRIANLIERGVTPGQVLAVTFTNKAAREMQARLGKLLPRASGGRQGSPSDRPTICTFHSFCVRVLRQYIERLGYKRNFVIYDESEQLGAVRKVLSHISAKSEKADPKAVLAYLSRTKNSSGPLNGSADESISALAERVRSGYQSTLRACNAVDFDDLLLLALRLFDEHPDVLEECRTRYRYVMVDEYQDTSAAQFRLVHLLTRDHRNLCVVGDDDQSIYGWRGAEISNLLDLEKHFPEVKIIKLEQNYRSTNIILSAANALIKNNARRRGKRLWSDKGPGTNIVLHPFANDEEEARTIVEQIEFDRKIQRVPWSEQAILFRTNLQSRALETALRQGKVAYHLIGGQSFFDRREIRDWIAYLKLFVNPQDDVSLLRIANVPARGLSDSTMQRLLASSQERKCSVHAAMVNPNVQMGFNATTRASLQRFLDLIESTRAPLLSTDPLSLRSWAERFIAEIGYLDELRRSEKNPDTAENRIRNLKDIMATLDEASSAGAPPAERLQDFLENLTLDADRAEEKEQHREAVTLITIHSCKGLEFPQVYIVGLEEGLLPHSRSREEGTTDEERRLFYVAITRAMRRLTMSYCLSRKKYGELVPCHPSSFLKEIPDHLIDRADEQSTKAASTDTGRKFFENLRASLEG